MALRGETIGTAFIRIVADGSGLDESIRKEMDKAEPVSEEEGRRNFAAFSKGFDDQAKKDKEFEKTYRQKFQTLEGQLLKLGKVAGKDMEQGITDGFTEAFKSTGIRDKDARNLGARAGKMWADGFAKSGSMEFDPFQIFSKSLEDFEREVGKAGKTSDGFWFHLRRGLNKGEGDAQNFGDRIGRLFGEGSRNNFLNIVGKGIGGIVNGVTTFGKTIGKIPSMVSGAVSSLRTLAGGGEEAGAKMAALGEKVGATLAKVGPSIAGIFVVVLGALGPIAGLISSLAAAITALASSVSFALAAGLGIFVGLLPLVAGGVGAFVIAIQGLRKDKALTKSIKPLVDGFKDLRATLSKGLAGGLMDVLPHLAKVFKDFPIKDLGKSLGDFVRNLAGAARKHGGLGSFIDAFGKALPDAIRSFGDIAGNIIGGFGGLFKVAIGPTQDFLGWITGLSEQFNDWANSAKGQSWLKTFFDRAIESAKTIGKFIGKIAEALGALLFSNQGRKAGDTIFGDLTKKLGEFVDFIKKAQADGDLAKWFQSGVDTARKVGDAIAGLITVFNTLDTPENRKAAAELFDGFAKAAKVMAVLIVIVQKVGSVIYRWLVKPIVDGLKGGWVILTKTVELFKNLYNGAKEWFPKAGAKVKEFAGDVGDWIGKAWGHVSDFLGKLADLPGKVWGWLSDVIAKFAGLAGKIIDKAGDLTGAFVTWVGSLASKAGSAVSDVIGKFAGLAGSIISKAGDLAGQIETWLSDLPDKAATAVSDIISAFTGLAGDIVHAIGTINIPWPSPPSWLGKLIPGLASGGIVGGPTLAVVGEAGPEAIVPLARNLAQVDPSVRSLSAFAQGKPMSGQTNVNRGVEVGGITIITPTENPVAVAQETINRLVASSYFGG